MKLYAAVAKRRLGEITGGVDGQRLIDEADRWMREQKIKVPEKITRMLAPGIVDNLVGQHDEEAGFAAAGTSRSQCFMRLLLNCLDCSCQCIQHYCSCLLLLPTAPDPDLPRRLVPAAAEI